MPQLLGIFTSQQSNEVGTVITPEAQVSEPVWALRQLEFREVQNLAQDPTGYSDQAGTNTGPTLSDSKSDSEEDEDHWCKKCANL